MPAATAEADNVPHSINLAMRYPDSSNFWPRQRPFSSNERPSCPRWSLRATTTHHHRQTIPKWTETLELQSLADFVSFCTDFNSKRATLDVRRWERRATRDEPLPIGPRQPHADDDDDDDNDITEHTMDAAQQPAGSLSWRLSSHPITLLTFLGFRICTALSFSPSSLSP